MVYGAEVTWSRIPAVHRNILKARERAPARNLLIISVRVFRRAKIAVNTVCR